MLRLCGTRDAGSFFETASGLLDPIAFLFSGLCHRCLVQMVALPADLDIDSLARTIHGTKRLVLRQRVPGVEREIFTKAIAFRREQVLGRNDDLRDMLGLSDRFLPNRSGILDRRAPIIDKALHVEIESRFALSERLARLLFKRKSRTQKGAQLEGLLA